MAVAIALDADPEDAARARPRGKRRKGKGQAQPRPGEWSRDRARAWLDAEGKRAPSGKRPKPKTLGTDRLTRVELAVRELLAEEQRARRRLHLPVLQMPVTRADCANVPRPCPFARCKHNNLLVEIGAKGHGNRVVKRVRPDLEPWEMDGRWSCDLDVAERGPTTVEKVADVLNMTEERVRQLQVSAYAKLIAAAPWLREVLETGGLLPEVGSEGE